MAFPPDCFVWSESNELNNVNDDANKLKNCYNTISSLEKENLNINKQIEELQIKYKNNLLKIEENFKEIESIIEAKKKVLKP